MRKLVLVAGVLALSACGGEADVAEEETAVVEEEVVEVPSVVGTYVATTEDGTEWTGTINADGTTVVEVGGEVVETGTWRSADDGTTCFINDTEEGEEPDEEDCMTFGEVQEDGTLEVVGSDGETDTLTKVS